MRHLRPCSRRTRNRVLAPRGACASTKASPIRTATVREAVVVADHDVVRIAQGVRRATAASTPAAPTCGPERTNVVPRPGDRPVAPHDVSHRCPPAKEALLPSAAEEHQVAPVTRQGESR